MHHINRYIMCILFQYITYECIGKKMRSTSIKVARTKFMLLLSCTKSIVKVQ